MDLIPTVNPGSTTTRVGLFALQGANVRPVHEDTIEHDEAVMAGFASIEYRAACLGGFLEDEAGGRPAQGRRGETGRDAVARAAGVIAVNPGFGGLRCTRRHHHASSLPSAAGRCGGRARGCPGLYRSIRSAWMSCRPWRGF
ncbi:MAG: hypothetical protein R3D53_14165 [Paracoccaceae bacterium]